MDSYKQKERSHYNSRYEEIVDDTNNVGLKTADIISENAITHFFDIVKEVQSLKGKGRILDYGCGTGDKSIEILEDGWEINGIDISEKSISVANKKYGSASNISFDVMDCENTIFPDNTFDIVFDFGTFSSINIKDAFHEIIRIMKPDGVLICIETLGHNPILNFKRKVNVWTGKRTEWASQHIMRLEDWLSIESKFMDTTIEYFAFASILFYPTIKILPKALSKRLLKILWELDDRILESNRLKKYAFKTVVCCWNKKENQ